MTMVYIRSELFTSRTGIHGGLRRGTAAAAVGAVLVLAAGVPASHGDDGNPQSGVDAGPGQDATGQDAPGQGRDGKEARQAASLSVLSVPAALLPAVTTSLAPAVTTAPTTASLALPAPLPSIPLPTPSDVPLLPAATAPAAIVPVPSSPSPESQAQELPAAEAPAAPTPETVAQAAAPGTVPVPSSESAGEVNGAAAAGGNPPAMELPAGESGAGQAGPGGESVAGAEAPVPAAATQAAAAPQEAGGPGPQAAGVPRSAAQSVGAIVKSQPELEAVMVGLGVGLVGLAAAAGAAYFRMRKP
ncbi:hypothetical protein PV768_02900 [Pseudarthrobacter sp. CC4]|uniref:hypothetical protein n=1 Tax=Pseudarthrobacter sp. CC4 TaxID=3029190 RepID=UPI003B8C0181